MLLKWTRTRALRRTQDAHIIEPYFGPCHITWIIEAIEYTDMKSKRKKMFGVCFAAMLINFVQGYSNFLSSYAWTLSHCEAKFQKSKIFMSVLTKYHLYASQTFFLYFDTFTSIPNKNRRISRRFVNETHAAQFIEIPIDVNKLESMLLQYSVDKKMKLSVWAIEMECLASKYFLSSSRMQPICTRMKMYFLMFWSIQF